MSVWKSPVLYFGVLLLLVVSLALAAPLVTDWNSYKPGLESFGKQLTGRDVSIGGDVEISLFPWPRMTADNVTVGNPQGFDGPPLLEAQTIQLELSLGGLLGGTLDVQSVEIIEPKVALLRDAEGAVNWTIGPPGGLHDSALLSQVRLDSIRMLSGSIRFEDRKQGFKGEFSTLDADMSADAIEGPWRIKGNGNWNEMPLAFNFTSSLYESGKPFRFGLRAVPGDTAFPVVSLDGAYGSAFDGSLKLEPQIGLEEKGSAESGLKPLTFESSVKFDGDAISLEKIKIAPADRRDSGTLIEGRATLALAQTVNALIELNAPRVNLDTLLGVEGMQTLRVGGMPALVTAFMRGFPERLKADFAWNLGVLTYGGETLQNVTIKAEAEKGKISLSEGRAGLPGRSAMLFRGDVLQRDGAPELAGRIDFESNDLRAFTRWLLPARAAAIDSNWKGSRGRLKLISNVQWSPTKTRFSESEFEFDGAAGKGGVSYTEGTPAALELDLDMRVLDIDNVLPGGLSGFGGGAFDALAVLAPLLTDSNQMERRVSIAAGEMTLNGQTAKDVTIDFEAGGSGINVKNLAIGSVGGAELKAKGLVINNREGPSGDFNARLVAEDPSGFLQLVGLATPASHWVRGLGQTDAAITLGVKPSPSGPVLSYVFKGKAGPQQFEVDGDVTALEQAGNAQVAMNGHVEAGEALQLLRLFGFDADVALSGSGKASFALNGSRADGFATRFEADVAGSTVTFDGRLKPDEAFAGASGTVNIVAPQAQPVFAVFGVPVTVTDGPLQLNARVAVEEGMLKANQLFGNLAQSAFKGEVAMDSTRRMTGDFETGEVDLTDLLAVALLPWDGRPPSMQTSFAQGDDTPVQGEFSIRPARLKLPYGEALPELAVVFSLAETRKVEVLSPTRPEIALSITLTPNEGAYDAKVTGSTLIDLAQVMQLDGGARLAEGTMKVKGEFAGEGRSPGALLSSLTGGGTYELSGAALDRLTPEALASRVSKVTSAEELTEALQALEAEGRFDLGNASGEFKTESGTVSISPLVLRTPNATTTIVTTVDLVAGEMESTATLELPAETGLPPVTIGYQGPPGELLRRASTSALAAKLGHAMLAKDLEELERLRQEQEKLEAAEQAQREADVAKFEAYQAQRTELRLRNRELKVFTDMRQRRQQKDAAAFAAFLPVADALNKSDLAKARLRLAVARNLADFTERRIAKAKAEEEANRKAEEERLRKVEEERIKAEQARIKALEEENARLEEEARKKAEAEAAARAKAEEEARLAAEEARKAEEDERKRQEEERARAQREKELREAQEKLRQQLEQEQAVPEPAPAPDDGEQTPFISPPPKPKPAAPAQAKPQVQGLY
ncbi:MAG: AsmA family protein [Proteobacteria bacterium]|nr:AsmA family protein [Pseudomonadota bacterium]